MQSPSSYAFWTPPARHFWMHASNAVAQLLRVLDPTCSCRRFFAPWCGHCKKMKPDWDTLAAEFQGSDKVLVADVDCTAGGKPLCDSKGVKGFPTIKSFTPGDDEGEDYKGGRDLATLKTFAGNLGPGCTVDTIAECTPEQKAKLDKYMAMDAIERADKINALSTAMKEAETAHDELLKNLQEQFKNSQDGLEKLKEETAPEIKMLKAASPSPKKAGAGKDEV